MEVVAFSASSKPVRVEMDAGHGFTPALVVPVTGGVAISNEFAVSNPADWELGVEGANLRIFRDLTGDAGGVLSSGADNGCATPNAKRSLYEVHGTGSLRVWLQAGTEQKEITLPTAASASDRLFLLVEREPGKIVVSASRAFVQLSPWKHFSQWIVALRVMGQDGKAAGTLVRVMSEGAGGYLMAQAEASEGAYQVPALLHPDTPAFLAMKVFAGLVGASMLLLIAAAGKVALVLARSFRDGRRVQVVASVLGCLGWLGLGVAVGWPAIIGWDGFSPYIQAQTGSITLWYGLGYPHCAK
jgi:hypothetical protein